MAIPLQHRRGTTAEHSTFTGALGEVTVDTNKDVVVVHDGATAGGFPMAKAPATSTDNAIARFDGTTGALQNSGVVIDDSGNLQVSTRIKVQSDGQLKWGNIVTTGSEANYGVLTWDTNKAIIHAPSTQSLILKTNNVDRVTVDASGNLTVNTGALGYGTGSGGTVTQLTSRTTGVTLNKPNGAITLVSAAGSTTWQTFTVTNSYVTATDTLYVCQKSGTDLYEIHVTNVSAGSFKISFKTTSGTTTEQPVFNFAVIKGVVA